MSNSLRITVAASTVLLLALTAPTASASSHCSVRGYAHRGTYAGAPHRIGNNLPAFLEVISAGGHGLETDLRITQDGHFVFMHNRGVAATTNGHGYIDQMTLAQVRRLRTDDGARVPTLQRVLNVLRPLRVQLLIEVKAAPGWSKAALHRLSRLVHRRHMAKRVLLNTGTVWMSKLGNNTQLRVLWKKAPGADPAKVDELGDGILARHVQPSYVRALHQRNLLLVARQRGHLRRWWHRLNTRAELATPDGLITGKIDRYARWCEQ